MPSDDEAEKPKRSDEKTRSDLWTVLEIQPCPDESQQSSYPNERRRHLRYSVARDCTYRLLEQSDFDSATLYDISESGLAIEVKHKMSLGRSLNILVDDKKSDTLPWLIRATVVRDAGIVREGVYRYGCVIKFIINPENYLD